MSITLEINAKQLHGSEPLHMQYLPAQIDGDGPANVDNYFNNYTREEDGILRNSLRGYPLQGELLHVPKGYKALVMQENQYQSMSEDAERKFRLTGSFDEFTYWNYDKLPSKGDGYKQALQVLQISEHLAKPVTNAEFDAEMKLFKEQQSDKDN